MNGVRVRFLHREELLTRLAALAKDLIQSRAEVLEVSLFGSLARADHAPGSDADIYILLKDHPARFLDRITEFVDCFSGMSVPVDVFPYTVGEVEKMKARGFMKAIKRERLVLASRTRPEPSQPPDR